MWGALPVKGLWDTEFGVGEKEKAVHTGSEPD